MGAITAYGRPPVKGDPNYEEKMRLYELRRDSFNVEEAKKPFTSLVAEIGGALNELEELFERGLMTQN